MRIPVVYADTSVFGGVFDEEFRTATRSFFDLVRAGRFSLMVSDVVRRELEGAPADVQSFFDQMLAYVALVPVDEEVLLLRDAYLDADILAPRWAEDATHVAAATIGRSDLIVSWNFRHMVHFDKIRFYNAVNALHGYPQIDIRAPNEVIDYEDEDV